VNGTSAVDFVFPVHLTHVGSTVVVAKKEQLRIEMCKAVLILGLSLV
jgi:hypothetical protein